MPDRARARSGFSFVVVPLNASDVHVWYLATASLDDDGVTAALSLLSPDERQRSDRFVFRRDRRDFAAAHALTRRVLSSYENVAPRDWTFEATADGKPCLPAGHAGGPPLVFNLSHTHGLVACAVARDGDIGLDVERIDRAVDARGIAARYFTAGESAFIDGGHGGGAGDRQVRFAEVWTLKEAFVKAVGRGLRQPLNAFGCVLEGSRGIRFDAPTGMDPREWTFALFAPSPDTRMAIAVRSPGGVARRIIARHGETVEGIGGAVPRLDAFRSNDVV